MKSRCCFLLLLFCCSSIILNAQDKPRFWEDVQTIKKYDQLFTPPANPVLFIGSSSIRKWNTLERDFASYNAINRGIGGAILNDISFYLRDMVLAYKPRQIVLYVGENDLPDETSTVDSIVNRTKNLLLSMRDSLPGVSIVYISMKPSPSREKYISKAIAANQLIRKFVATQPKMVFVDVFTPMLTKAGKTRPELFVGDMLHMNAQGYAIWKKAVQPHLLKQ